MEEVLRDLETSEAGLSEEEAAARLDLYGPNALTPPKKPGFLAKLWVQVNNVSGGGRGAGGRRQAEGRGVALWVRGEALTAPHS